MKLSEIKTKQAHESGVLMTVINPSDGKETDFKIQIVGADSSVYRRSVRELASRIASGQELDQDNEQAIIISNLILDWSGLVDDDGNEVKFTREIAESLLQNSPWLCDQIERFVNNRSNFTKG